MRHVPPTTVPCPACGKAIDPVARQCEHCGDQLPITPEFATDSRAVVEVAYVAPRRSTPRRRTRMAVRGATPVVPVATPPVPTPPAPTPPAPVAPPPLPRRSKPKPLPPEPEPVVAGPVLHADLPPPPDPPAPERPAPERSGAGALAHRLLGTRAALTSTALVLLGLGIVITVAVLAYVALHHSSTSSRAGSLPTANQGAGSPLASAAGKPCVAMTDPLPAGAPATQGIVGPAPTELVVEDLTRGTGASVASTGTVTVNYIGVACSTGRIFSSSYQTGGAVDVPLGDVITGWTEGVTGMKVGGQRLIAVPSALAYGAEGAPPLVAPDDAVWFVVEVTGYTP